MKTYILDVPFDTYTRKEALEKVCHFLEEEKNHLIITPNPEIVIEAKKDEQLFRIIEQADLVVPDGIGVVLASKLNKVKIKERVAGYDLIQSLFASIKDTGSTIYFFGGAKGVAQMAKKAMEQKYPGIQIIGVHDGYFDEVEEKKVIEEIKLLKPDILLVGLGAPKQEKWAAQYKEVLPVKLTCCVGGSFDGMAGVVKRAPMFFQKTGLEWFYRLLKQPSRIGRMMRLPLFVLVVIKTKVLEVLNIQ